MIIIYKKKKRKTLVFFKLKVGEVKKPLSKSKERVKLASVNLEANRIRSVFLLNEPIQIKRLNLAQNEIEKLSIRANLDICTLKIESLNVSSNQIKQIEIGYLIFLHSLNLSYNQLASFDVDFYDTREFFSYARTVCQINYTTYGNIEEQQYELNSNLVEIDFTNNLLSSLPLTYLKNIAFNNLEKLIVAANQIKIVSEFDLKNLKNMRHLSLKSNAIE